MTSWRFDVWNSICSGSSIQVGSVEELAVPSAASGAVSSGSGVNLESHRGGTEAGGAGSEAACAPPLVALGTVGVAGSVAGAWAVHAHEVATSRPHATGGANRP